MQGSFYFVDLCLSGFGDTVGIVPELLLIDAGYSFQSGLGKDSAIYGQQALDVHLEFNGKLSGQFFRDFATQLITGLDKGLYCFQKISLLRVPPHLEVWEGVLRGRRRKVCCFFAEGRKIVDTPSAPHRHQSYSSGLMTAEGVPQKSTPSAK